LPRLRDSGSPLFVGFPYVPKKNIEPESGTLLQVVLFIEVLWIGTLIATFTGEHRRKINPGGGSSSTLQRIRAHCIR
jgi:hypothetical protein